MKDIFAGARNVRVDRGLVINHIRGDQIQVFHGPEEQTEGVNVQETALPPSLEIDILLQTCFPLSGPSIPIPSSRNQRTENWTQTLPPPPSFIPVPDFRPRETRYYYVSFSIDRDASLRTLERDSRLGKSAAIRSLIDKAPKQRFFGYLYYVRFSLDLHKGHRINIPQIGGKESGCISNHYQIYCLRSGHPPEVKEDGIRPDMCIAVAHQGTTKDPAHRTPLRPSPPLPWNTCYHSSFDILPVMIEPSSPSPENAETHPESPVTLLDTCPSLSGSEVARHGDLIAQDLKRRAKLASSAKRESRDLSKLALPTGHSESSSQANTTLALARPCTIIQKHSWALITVKISYELDEKSKSEIQSGGLNPSELIQLQSDLVAEVRHKMIWHMTISDNE